MVSTKKISQGELITASKKLSNEQRKYISDRIKEIAGGVPIKIINIRKKMQRVFGGNVNQLYVEQMPEIETFLKELTEKEKNKDEKAADLGRAFMNSQSQKNNPEIVLPSLKWRDIKVNRNVKSEEPKMELVQGKMTTQASEQNEVEIYKRLEDIGTVFNEFQNKKIIDMKLKTLDTILAELREIKEKI